jgi:methyl-accepting chemotaxis protein
MQVMSRMKDAETGQRGYLLTGSEDYLEPYRAAVADIPGLLDNLAAGLGTDPTLSAGLTRLRILPKEKLAELARTTQLRRDQGFEAAVEVVRTDAGRRTMDSIRAVAGEMISRETQLLQARRNVVERSSSRTFLLTLLGLSSLLLAMIFLEWAMSREVVTRRHVAEALDKAHIIICRLDGTIFYWNRAAESIYGWTTDGGDRS